MCDLEGDGKGEEWDWRITRAAGGSTLKQGISPLMILQKIQAILLVIEGSIDC